MRSYAGSGNDGSVHWRLRQAAPWRRDEMTIAVFTKNLTNPAYEAFRIAADQIARSTGARSCTSFRSSRTMSTSRRRWWNRS